MLPPCIAVYIALISCLLYVVPSLIIALPIKICIYLTIFRRPAILPSNDSPMCNLAYSNTNIS
ncbi:uncharacterized protein B0H18DRAFT_1020436, partial [Fomitopsis serialis]|uniref:uncharacterized protein n=1 Tax=Fomitopsis serialis TaxID=139415 RepID=UPI002007324C